MEKGFVNCKVLYNDNKCMFSFIEHHKLRDAEGSTSQALSYLSLLIQKISWWEKVGGQVSMTGLEDS